MIIVGIDEAGRGCWAGPLVAAAVVLNEPIVGIGDSKILTRKKRELLDQLIRSHALSYGIGWVSAAEVDKLGLTAATSRAMTSALEAISCDYDEIVIDGNYNYLPTNSSAVAVIKADATVPAVSAASILAKVARDSYMLQLSQELPQYQFEAHVGYGTALHLELLLKYGVSEHHRKSYKPIQKILSAQHDKLSDR